MLLKVARTLVLLPLVLPPVVGGIALLSTYGRRGLVGPLADALGIDDDAREELRRKFVSA